MVKVCLMALLLGVAFSAQAVMVGWKVPAWNDTFLQSGNVNVYLVSSQTGTGWDASSGNWETDSSAGVNAGWDATKLSTSSSNYGKFIENSGKAYIWANVGSDKVLSGGSYYSLVFVVKSGEDVGHYAITQGKKYTGTWDPSGKGGNGYYLPAADGSVPPWAEFVDSDWLFTNVKGTPEPTALALLAFGLAGLALRRRVSL